MGETIATHRLEHMTWPDVQRALESSLPILIPVGSIEQHGPHLPLGTDGFIPHLLCLRVAHRRPVVVAPPLLYATYSRPRSGGGRSFKGSTGMPADVFTRMVTSVVADLCRQGFTRLAVLNGHFENSSALYESLEEAMEAYASTHKALLMDWWQLLETDEVDDIFGGRFPGWEAEHASLLETSLMEELLPELVRTDLKEEGGAPRLSRYDIFPTPQDIVPPTGVGWTAVTASRELGRRVANLLVERIVEVLDAEFPDARIRPELEVNEWRAQSHNKRT